MKQRVTKLCIAYFVLLLHISLSADDIESNPLLKTIAGSEESHYYKEINVPIRHYVIDPVVKKELPKIFYDFSKTTFSYAAQSGKAPLIFLIAGTGSHYNVGKMQYLQKVFWDAGYHVVNLNSPINRNFIATTSATGLVGFAPDDARDLHMLMKNVLKNLPRGTEVTTYNIAGYSLGGLEACFVAHFDDNEKFFNFSKVLAINPPLDVYSSISILDDFLTPQKGDPQRNILDRMMDKVALYFAKNGNLSSDEDIFYEVHELCPLTDLDAQQLIGLSFRMSLAEMVMITDLMTNKEYVIDEEPTFTTPMLPYFKKCLRWTFRDYAKYYLADDWLKKNPTKTFDNFVHLTSLNSISDYLKSSSKFTLIHNQDDIIMSEGEIDTLKTLFSNSVIYKTGGHCGNFYSKKLSLELIKFAAKE